VSAVGCGPSVRNQPGQSAALVLSGRLPAGCCPPRPFVPLRPAGSRGRSAPPERPWSRVPRLLPRGHPGPPQSCVPGRGPGTRGPTRAQALAPGARPGPDIPPRRCAPGGRGRL